MLFRSLEVTRFLKVQNPPSLELEKEFVDKMARDPDSVFWIIERDGRIIGGTSIVRIDWRNGFGTTGTVIGDKSMWGKGFAGEVMRLRADYAFTQLPLRKLKSAYLAGNEASARAQKAVGYREVGRWTRDRFIDGEWRDHVMTELMREDWENKASV